MSVKLNSTGGGSVTLDSPSTASNYTVTLPSAAGTLATTTGTGSVFTNPTINGFTGDTSAITVGTTQFVKDTSGNIGIGTASPSAKLSIGSGTLVDANVPIQMNAAAGSGQAYIGFNNAGGYGLLVGYDNAAGYARIRNISNTSLAFSTNDTERMRLDGSGALTVPNIYTNTTAAVSYVAVSSAGLLQRGGVSALKYKQDIRDLESIDINKFRAVRYKSKCENDDQTIDYFGFIADEVEEAGIKELITYNDDGEPEGFQYERMTVVLLKTIQELSAQNQALEARLAQLEAK